MKKLIIFLSILCGFASQKDSITETPVNYQTDPDPINVVHSAKLTEAKQSSYKSYRLDQKNIYTAPFERKETREKVVTRKLSKLHPMMDKWLAKKRGDEYVDVVITLQEDTQMPRFPEPNTEQARNSAFNAGAAKEAQRMIDKLLAKRAQSTARVENMLKGKYKSKIVERYWLVNGFAASIPVRSIRELVADKQVQYIEPVQTNDMPPSSAGSFFGTDAIHGRQLISSDPYFNLGQTAGWIALLDTGIRSTHQMFNSPSMLGFRLDCVNGGTNCNSGSNLNPNDDCWNHGTSSAGIISGNNRSGNQYRGVTGITLDAFKVYPTSFNSSGRCNGGLHTSATLRAFQRAVALLDKVIVAEMQGGGNENSSISMAGDNAFNTGAVIIAANGNNGPNPGTVNTPANAHRVLGVGNFDVHTQNQVNSQSRGAAADGRIKPDIQAPTNARTASASSNTALRNFSGTSGATPFAAGGAALLRNWLRGNTGSIDPGQVYAQMILSGQKTYPFNNTSGAGKLKMITGGWAWWGKTSVSNNQNVDIPITVNYNGSFDGAIWWPESGSTHNDIDLQLIDPTGRIVAYSHSGPSVFERARATGPLRQGRWILRIRGYSVSRTQTVYWAAHAK